MNMNFLGKYEEAIYLVLRVVTGLLFACHGAQKLFGAFGGPRASNGMMLVSGSVEFFGGVLVALGLVTVIAAFFTSGEMAVAYFTVHAKGGIFPILNRGELAVIYCFVFLYIVFRGPGLYSIDNVIMRNTPLAGAARRQKTT